MKADAATSTILNLELFQALVTVLEKDRPNLREEIRDHLTGRANLYFLDGGFDENAAICAMINGPFLTDTN